MISGIENVTSYAETVAAQEAEALPSQDMAGQDTFLKLLVAQMQNQDPLEPQSNEDFVAQLAQFSSLEQLMSVNTSLDSLYQATSSMNNASMTNLLGRTVLAYSEGFEYDGAGGKDVWLDVRGDAEQVTLTITDESGKVVRSEELGAMDVGEHSWDWDGTNVHGNMVGEGTYTMSVTAKNNSGEDVEVFTMLRGEVDGMSYATGVPIPSVEGTDVGIGDIIRLESGDTDADGEDDGDDEDAI
jgi:flagellar basal-body rod modification protein FlgD